MPSIRLDDCRCTLSYEDKDTYCLMALYTEQKSRGQGQAKRLLRAVKKWADRKKKRVILFVGRFDDTGPDNSVLQSFYERMGWRAYDTRHTVWMEYNHA